MDVIKVLPGKNIKMAISNVILHQKFWLVKFLTVMPHTHSRTFRLQKFDGRRRTKAG